MEIRWASPFDISSIAALIVVMHKEAEFELATMNSEKLMSQINELVHRGIVLVAVEDGRIVGTIGGRQGLDWWSDEKYFGDLWFYVLKEARSSRTAISLVKRFVKEIKNLSPDIKIRLGHVFSGDCDRKDKFFERLGFKKAGSVFMEV
jgi:L-amino acid N-acyltransferase YncA|tara:strand:+ start:1231 stop:1674 length:444 start_codon:yes stop_codon:yes gene_type:complete